MSDHASTPTPPAQNKGGAGWIVSLLLVAVAIVLVIARLKSNSKPETVGEAPHQQSSQFVPAPQQAEVEVLQTECFTPCKANIAWKFRIRSDDRHSLRVTYQGAGVVVYPAGDTLFAPPENMLSGDTKFESPDGTSFRVQVYRLVLTPKTW